MTPLEIARAWHSVSDRWFVRRNKSHDRRQWEVVHDWGGDLVSDETMKVVARYEDQDGAERKAALLENIARGTAVATAYSRS